MLYQCICSYTIYIFSILMLRDVKIILVLFGILEIKENMIVWSLLFHVQCNFSGAKLLNLISWSVNKIGSV